MGNTPSVIEVNAEGLPTQRKEEEGNWITNAIKKKSKIHDIGRDQPNDDGSPCMENIDIREPDDSFVLIKCSCEFQNNSTRILFGNSIGGPTSEVFYDCFKRDIEEITMEIVKKSPKYSDSFTVIYESGDVSQYHHVRLSKGEKVVMVWIDVAHNVPEIGGVVKNCPALLKCSQLNDRIDILLCNGVWAEWIKNKKVYLALKV